jgi:hypothetical protein
MKLAIASLSAAREEVRRQNGQIIPATFPGSGYNRPMQGGYSVGGDSDFKIANPFAKCMAREDVWSHASAELGTTHMCVVSVEEGDFPIPVVNVRQEFSGATRFEDSLVLA